MTIILRLVDKLADTMTCPPPVPVTIDVKPGNAKNQVKPSSKGTLAVAVLTTDTFDATQFSPEMAHLNDANTPMADACMGASAVRWSLDDENGDGSSKSGQLDFQEA